MDGTRLVSTSNGSIQVKHGMYSVHPTYIVNQDVDYSTGNVKYAGDVVVRGTIRQGFEVFSDSDVRVGRMIESGFCCSLAGSITVSDGANGAYVMAGGSVSIGYAEYSSLTAGKNVTIGRYTLDCNIFAEGQITVTSTRGVLKGGVIRAGTSIVTPEAGSPGMFTRLILKDNTIQNKLSEVERLLLRYRQQYEQKQIDYGQYQRKRRSVTPMLDEVYGLYSGSFIEVKKTIHPGTTFSFADREVTFHKPHSGGRFTFGAGKILLDGEEIVL